MEFISTKCIWGFGQPKAYRFSLERIWDADGPFVAFIGLNPSTADEHKPDPTVTRCVNFANAWGYGGMYMLNAFAFRATDPKAMKACENPVGVGNDGCILGVIAKPAVTKVVLCWGTHAVHQHRNDEMMTLLKKYVRKLYVFEFTKDGHPKHPLYLPNNIKLQKVKLFDFPRLRKTKL